MNLTHRSLLLSLVGLAACKDPAATSNKTEGSATLTASSAASARPASRATASATTSASAAPAASAFSRPAPTLEKTKIPTVKEWLSAREVPLLGAAALGCEAKMVREWIRVSCRDANGGGGVPSAVDDAKGGGADVYTFAKNGVASVVTRFLPGTEFSAKFSWDDGKSYPLTLSWAAGSKELPGPVGKFDGAPDAPTPGPDRKGLCYCFRLMFGGPMPADPSSCAGVPADAFAPECVRAHHPAVGEMDSCGALIECQNFEPSGLAECLPDETYTGVCPSCRCAKACGPGKPACPKGLDCVDNMGRGGNVCLEP